MSPHAVVPGRRSALDEGSWHDLCLDCAQVMLMPPPPARPTSAQQLPPVVVPDDVRHLLDDLPPYGT